MKRRVLKSVFSIVLCLSLLCTSAQASWFVEGVGSAHRMDTYTIGDRTSFVSGTFTYINGTRQEERYIEWAPGGNISPMVSFGKTIYGVKSFADIYNRLTESGIDPVAIINGDFFDLSTGVPSGVVIYDGILRASDNYAYSLGFSDTGSAFITKSPMYITVSYVGGDGAAKSFPVEQMNHTRMRDRMILYTPDFGEDTKTNLEGVHMVLNAPNTLTVGGSVSGTVAEVITGTAPAALRSGQMVLSANALGPVARFADLKPGMNVTIKVTCADTRYKTCRYAIGGDCPIISEGSIPTGLSSTAAPRTAVGVRADGSCVFFTVDGRQNGYSTGLSLGDVARRLIGMGCINAINLDGGGSTALALVYPGKTAPKLVGKPSEGVTRKVSNYLVLWNNSPRLNSPAKLFVYPEHSLVLAGTPIAYEVTATDANFHAYPSLPQYTMTLPENMASQGGINIYTPSKAGTFTISANPWDYSITQGSAVVRAMDKLDRVVMLEEKNLTELTSLGIAPGGTVELKAQGWFDSLPVYSMDKSFKWEITGNIGTITENGLFTASSQRGASGIISVSYGGVSASLPVTLEGRPQVVENFETQKAALFTGSADITFGYDGKLDNVAFGLKAGKLDYKFTGEGQTLSVSSNISLPRFPYLNLWIKGDNTENKLSLTTKSTTGEIIALPVCDLNFTGYRMFTLALPVSCASVTSISVQNTTGAPKSGTIYIDQLICSYENPGNTLPPAILNVELSQIEDEGIITADITDYLGLAVDRLTVTINRVPIPVQYDKYTGKLTIRYTMAEPVARLAIDAADSAGNLSRKTILLKQGQTPVIYSDVAENFWGAWDIALLSRKGIITQKDGEYLPAKPFTRADMANYISGMLSLDLSKYGNVSVPFTDMESIKDEKTALAVRAIYSLGITSGKTLNGKSYYDPTAPITRSDFSVMLSKLLPRGYTKVILEFTDKDKIPSYAVTYVEELVGMGAISGFPDKTFRPQNNISRAEAATLISKLY